MIYQPRPERLIRLHQTLTAALPYVGTRQLGNGQTVEELRVESAFAAVLQPTLEELYRYPLRNGIDAVPDLAREALIQWFRTQYEDEAVTAVLRRYLKTYFTSAFNAGGTLALQELGAAGTFDLADETLLAIIEETAVSYVDPYGDISLTNTTAVDLGRRISGSRADGLTAAEISALLAAYINGRVLTRSSNIAATETVGWTRKGLGTTYDKNGIEYMIYKTAPELSETGPCPICEPYDGRRLRASNGSVWFDLIPQHSGCVCYYVPDTTDWTLPEEVWTGE